MIASPPISHIKKFNLIKTIYKKNWLVQIQQKKNRDEYAWMN
jgi:hypothetical protein